MKKAWIWIVLGIIGFVVAGCALVFQGMTAKLESLRTEELAVVPLSEVPDGTFRGTFSAPPISVVVDVTVGNGTILGIDIVRHVNGQGAAGEAVVDAVLTAQSLDVDAVAGATYSSMCILLAIENALMEQNPGESD